ncbi:MAG: anthranilate phosphoribosyltransferase [Gemmatimonas sp.]
MSDALVQALKKLAANESLDAESISSAFGQIMRGEGTPAQVAAMLMALRVKGETPTEVAGVARAMRSVMNVLPAADPHLLVDTCGTGGGTLTTFNISTAAALLAAGAGVRIAKHGNRSFSSRSGSADVLEALGVAIEVSPDTMLRTLNEAGIVFMFAPLMHPAMRHVGPVRRELTVGTVMNVVGPLANPARAGRQVLGVAEKARLPLLAGALAELGTEHALIVHGEPGLDEISPLGPTTVIEIRSGRTSHWEIQPSAAGEAGISASDLVGGGPEENAAVIEAVLAGSGKPGARAAVVLNAAAAIYVAGAAESYESAVERARVALVEGSGLQALERLRRASPRG